MRVLLSRIGPAFVAAVAVLSAALAASESHAADVPPVVAYALKGGTVAGGPITTSTPSDFERLIQARPGGGVIVQDAARIKGVGASDFDVLLKRPIVSKKLIQAGAVGLKGLPVVGTGIALWEIYDVMRVRPDGQGGLTRDAGTLPAPSGDRCFVLVGPQGQVGGCHPSVGAACASQNLYQVDARTCRVQPNAGAYFDAIEKDSSLSVSCPASIDFENPAYSVPAGGAPGLDGKCKRARSYWTPVTPEQVADIAESDFPGFQPNPVDLAGHALGRGVDLAPYVDGPGQLSGPSSVPGPATTTTNTPAPTAENPNPAPVTTTTNTTVNITYNTNNYSTSNTTVTNNPDGSTTTASSEPTEVCGLPGKPACKLDETGTPQAENPDEADARTAWQRLKDIATDPASALPSLPGLTWSFQLPTGCSVIPLPAFEPFISGVDVCQFQPMFHEIMSLVWIIGGLFGAIGLFWRDQMGIT